MEDIHITDLEINTILSEDPVRELLDVYRHDKTIRGSLINFYIFFLRF